MSEQKTYTLNEARLELIRRALRDAGGHDFEIVSTGDGEPVKLVCRCGRSWKVSA